MQRKISPGDLIGLLPYQGRKPQFRTGRTEDGRHSGEFGKKYLK